MLHTILGYCRPFISWRWHISCKSCIMYQWWCLVHSWAFYMVINAYPQHLGFFNLFSLLWVFNISGFKIFSVTFLYFTENWRNQVIPGVETLGNGRKSPHLVWFYSHRSWQALVAGKSCVWYINLLYYYYQHDKDKFIYIFYKTFIKSDQIISMFQNKFIWTVKNRKSQWRVGKHLSQNSSISDLISDP